MVFFIFPNLIFCSGLRQYGRLKWDPRHHLANDKRLHTNTKKCQRSKAKKSEKAAACEKHALKRADPSSFHTPDLFTKHRADGDWAHRQGRPTEGNIIRKWNCIAADHTRPQQYCAYSQNRCKSLVFWCKADPGNLSAHTANHASVSGAAC